MLVLDRQPNTKELHTLIARVPQYPISAEAVVNVALHCHADREVIDFYRSFSPDTVFSNEAELIAKTDQLELLEEQDATDERAATYEEFDSY